LPALLLLFSGTMKLLKAPAVIEGMAQYGYPERLILYIGVLEVGCMIVYLIPRTAILGAILMTGYLGGATATNVRVGDPSLHRTGSSWGLRLGRVCTCVTGS
jgi:DoxX-like family